MLIFQGTEHLRWMGESRFLYGFMKGLIANKSCPVQLEFLNMKQDKQEILAGWQANHVGQLDTTNLSAQGPVAPLSNKEEWVKFEKPWLYFV